MPRVCTICHHDHHSDIDALLVSGNAPLRDIARRWRVSKDALARHRDHLPRALVKAKEAQEAADAGKLLARVTGLCDRSERLLDQAEAVLADARESKDSRTAIGAIKAAALAARELRGHFELLGRVSGELVQSDGQASYHQNAVIIVPPPVPLGQPIPPELLYPPRIRQINGRIIDVEPIDEDGQDYGNESEE